MNVRAAWNQAKSRMRLESRGLATPDLKLHMSDVLPVPCRVSCPLGWTAGRFIASVVVNVQHCGLSWTLKPRHLYFDLWVRGVGTEWVSSSTFCPVEFSVFWSRWINNFRVEVCSVAGETLLRTLLYRCSLRQRQLLCRCGPPLLVYFCLRSGLVTSVSFCPAVLLAC